jgi:uncharacterized membrane protein YhaH (DUF805 family)
LRPIQAITACLRKAFDFTGNTSLSEFRWFFIFFVLGSALTFSLRHTELPYFSTWAPDFKYGAPNLLFTTIFLLPLVSAGARRFRDTGAPAYFFPLLIAIIISIEWRGAGPNFASSLASMALFFQSGRLSSSAPPDIWLQNLEAKS